MFEIQSSQLALAKQADADTKPFAERWSRTIRRLQAN
jgi:hypothetical protein